MRTIVNIAFKVWVVAISIWAVFTSFLIFYGWPLDKASAQYAESTVTPNITNLSQSGFRSHASPQLNDILNDAELNHKFYNLSLLGSIKNRTGYVGHATYNIGATNTAHYEANAAFENASATIVVDLIQTNKSWAIADIKFIVPVNGEIKTLQFSDVTANKSSNLTGAQNAPTS